LVGSSTFWGAERQAKEQNFNAYLCISYTKVSIQAGNYADSLGQLQTDILGKTDGCATSGAPDTDDWIVNCPDQVKVYTPLLNIIAEVKS
jgi:hypothetical protein